MTLEFTHKQYKNALELAKTKTTTNDELLQIYVIAEMFYYELWNLNESKSWKKVARETRKLILKRMGG